MLTILSKQWEASSVTTINLKLGWLSGGLLTSIFLAVLLTAFTITTAVADDARTIRLLRPLDGATVREMVPIRISPSDLPSDGYVTVSIDKVFRSAQLIEPGNSLIYTWDTQAAYQDPNDPGVDKYTDDGTHEIEIAVYDRQGNLTASGTSTIRLANKVTNLPDGITLSYNWSQDETLRYKRHSELNMLSTGGDDSSQNVETADIRFARSIEDATGGEYLVRDLVYEDGIITEHGTQAPVQSLFTLKSRYRTVNRFGQVLVEETPFSTGDHFGFPIPEVKDQRITVGDSWEAQIEASVTWANLKPTELAGNARLDSFEWQDGYPTAKVIETYDGPGQFYADARGTVTFQADNIHLVRTYWFAYNSKRLVRVHTEMTIDGNVDPSIVTAFGTGASGSGTGPSQVQNPFGGIDGTGDNNPMGGGPGGNGAGGTQKTTVPIKLQVIDDSTLVGV
jgi:hypothetical protein